jgi:hypothetical protein
MSDDRLPLCIALPIVLILGLSLWCVIVLVVKWIIT